MNHYERIRNLSAYGSNKWLYAAIRAANEKEPGHIQMVLNALRKRTPRDILRMFPPTKDYDGARWGCKDYFYTMEKVQAFGLNKPLGKHVEAFLWDYMEPHLNNFLCDCGLRHIGKQPWRALSVLDEHIAPPLLSVINLCDAANCLDSFTPIYNLIFRGDEALDGVYLGSDFRLDYAAFHKNKSILSRYIRDDLLTAAKELYISMGKIRAINLERDYSLAILNKASAHRLKVYLKKQNEPKLVNRVRDARRRSGVLRWVQRWIVTRQRDLNVHILAYRVRKAMQQ